MLQIRVGMYKKIKITLHFEHSDPEAHPRSCCDPSAPALPALTLLCLEAAGKCKGVLSEV